MAYSPDKKLRPRHLYLTSTRLPLPALVSILHRVSGFVLFLVIPLLLLVLKASLQSQQQFDAVVRMLAHPIAKLLLAMLLLAGFHHVLAGMRHLVLNMRWGHGLAHVRRSSFLVLALDAVLLICAAVWLW